MRSPYESPALLRYGSVVSLTLGGGGSDIDGESGMVGNRSMSDGMMAGNNDGGMLPR